MVIFKVGCGHPSCQFSTRVILNEDPGAWKPTIVSNVIGPGGEPIITPWLGQPLLDAYAQHYGQVHQPLRQPPMCEWRIVA
jgi:hypothetical protein